MQATVSAFNPATWSGAVLLDDGVRLTFGPEAVDSALLQLRPGQRVHIEVDGTVVRVLSIIAR